MRMTIDPDEADQAEAEQAAYDKTVAGQIQSFQRRLEETKRLMIDDDPISAAIGTAERQLEMAHERLGGLIGPDHADWMARMLASWSTNAGVPYARSVELAYEIIKGLDRIDAKRPVVGSQLDDPRLAKLADATMVDLDVLDSEDRVAHGRLVRQQIWEAGLDVVPLMLRELTKDLPKTKKGSRKIEGEFEGDWK